MPLDATRGLPTFSEMLGAFKNRASLGNALGSGIEGYQKAKANQAAAEKQRSSIDLESAQAEHYRAKANEDPYRDYVDIRSLEPNLTPEQYNAMKLTATPMGDRLLVKKDTVAQTIPLVRQASSDANAEAGRKSAEELLQIRMEQQRQENMKAQKEQSDRTNKIQEETNRRQAAGQALSASQDVLKEATKRPMLMKGIDKVFQTDRQKEIDRAQRVREQALGGLQAGETAMINPKTGEIVAVTPDEMGDALSQGYMQYTGK